MEDTGKSLLAARLGFAWPGDEGRLSGMDEVRHSYRRVSKISAFKAC